MKNVGIIDRIIPKLLALAIALCSIGVYVTIIGVLVNELGLNKGGPLVLIIILILISLIGSFFTIKMGDGIDENNVELLLTIYLDVVSVLGLVLVFIYTYIVFIDGSVETSNIIIANKSIFVTILTYRIFGELLKRIYYKVNNMFSDRILSLEKSRKSKKITLYFVGLLILSLSYVPIILLDVTSFEFNGVNISLVAIETVVLPAILLNLAFDQLVDAWQMNET